MCKISLKTQQIVKKKKKQIIIVFSIFFLATKSTCDLSKAAADNGADGVLVMSPFYFKTRMTVRYISVWHEFVQNNNFEIFSENRKKEIFKRINTDINSGIKYTVVMEI